MGDEAAVRGALKVRGAVRGGVAEHPADALRADTAIRHGQRRQSSSSSSSSSSSAATSGTGGRGTGYRVAEHCDCVRRLYDWILREEKIFIENSSSFHHKNNKNKNNDTIVCMMILTLIKHILCSLKCKMVWIQGLN